MIDLISLGGRIAECRKTLRLTQAELARRAGVRWHPRALAEIRGNHFVEAISA
jgi:transcriptional regulator with XRE-family HTH domain